MPHLRRSISGTSDVGGEDMVKLVEDWGKLSAEILKLKCNQYGVVSTVRKLDLQRGLYDYFHTNNNYTEVARQAPAVSTQVQENSILAELRLLRNEMNVIKGKQNEMLLNPIPSHHQVSSPTIQPHVSPPIISNTPITVAGNNVNMAARKLRPLGNAAAVPQSAFTTTSQPVFGFQLPEFMESGSTAPGINFDSSVNVPQNVNPFIPTTTRISILKKN